MINHKEILEEAKKSIIDPLGIKLANQVQWWKLKDLTEEINYEYPVALIGQGEPILMLHGFDSSFLEFRRIVPLLSKNNRIIIPDLFGFGFCPRPKNTTYGKNKIILHLEKIIEHLNTDKPLGLIGASMGGGIAMELARKKPEAINRLLLLSPAGLTGKPKPIPPFFDQIGVWVLSQPFVREGLCKQAFANPKGSVGEAEKQIASIHLKVPGWEESLASFARGGGIANCGSPLPKQKLQILWGEKDRILQGKVKKDTYKMLGPYIEEIKNCGHLPHLDQPKLVARKWDEDA